MICIKCSADTSVTNSRPHKKTPSVWRRRQCKACGTVFTTNELVADDTHRLTVQQPDGSAIDFSFPRLMVSIYQNLGHRPSASNADEAYWLAQTVAQTIQASATDTLTHAALSAVTHETIAHFDATAGLSYGVRHGILHTSDQRPVRGRPRSSRRGIN